MEIEIAARAFGALGQPARLEVMQLLLGAGPNGLAAGELARHLAVSPSTLSFHLRALEQSGLVGVTRQGRSLIYAASIDALRRAMTFLTDACCAADAARCGDLATSPSRLRWEPAATSDPDFTVLFLCSRNSARSIMAEAILQRLAPGRFRTLSAGTEPALEGPLPEVLAQLKALGHDVSGLRSKGWQEFTGAGAPRIDFVIALCDVLAGQQCPEFGAATITAAWPLPDPAKFNGSAAERATLLNELYAGLRRRLEAFSSLPFASLDRLALKRRLETLAQPQEVR